MSISSIKHPVRDQAVYYAMKTTGALLVAGGVAVAVTGSIYTWPEVTRIIGSRINGMPVEAVGFTGKAVDSLILIFFTAIKMCSQMPNKDIGGFCTLGVITIGAVVVLGPLLLAFGSPILAGSLVSSGGLALWNEADAWGQEAQNKVDPSKKDHLQTSLKPSRSV